MLGMPRAVAWLIAIIALVLAWIMALTPFTHPLQSFASDREGGLERRYAECPSPFSFMVQERRPPDPDHNDECRLASRTLLFETGFVLLSAGIIVWAPLTRRRPIRIRPLSERLGRHRHHPEGDEMAEPD